MTMFHVDDESFTAAWLAQAESAFHSSGVLAGGPGTRLAACLDDPALLLSLCLHCKREGKSFFPLPPGSPFEAAVRQAKRGGCHALIHKSSDSVTPLTGAVQDAEGCLIQTSSGTTGEPKVITRSWASIDREIAGYTKAFAASADMTPLIACPVNHSYGLISGVLSAIEQGKRPIVIHNLNPKYIIRKMMETERPLLYASPVLIHTVSLLYPRDRKLHAVMTSGTNMRLPLFEHLKERATFVFQQYGCSEAGCISVSENPSDPSDIGVALPHFRIGAGDSEHNPVEIVVHDGAETIRTRDLGYISSSGSLRLVSRIDDMINVAGVNVYPVEVENVILEYQGIEDAVVFKRENALGHTQVWLRYVSGGKVTPEQLRQWCSTELTPHQRPFRIEEVDAIKRMANGKINRRALAQEEPEKVSP
jgi:3,4-dihydroxybenzoate---[aryl-carrier protein] ligase